MSRLLTVVLHHVANVETFYTFESPPYPMPTTRRLRDPSAPRRLAPPKVALVQGSRACRPLPGPLPLEGVRAALRATLPSFGSEPARVSAAEKLEALVPVFQASRGPVAQQLGRRLSQLARALRTNSMDAAEASYGKAKERLDSLLLPPGTGHP